MDEGYAELEATVFDAVGRLGADRFDPGEHEVTWDGQDANGRRVGTGIYFVRVEGHNGLAGTVKILVAR